MASEPTTQPTQDLFEEAFKVFPRRHGSNPKSLARQAWIKRMGENGSEENMYRAALAYRDHCREHGHEGTHYVMQMKTFYGPSLRYIEFIPG